MKFILRVLPNSPLPIFAQIVREVRQAIAQGRLKPGDQIPTVRDLAKELLVNPNTVAKAYRQLEASGAISTRFGAGTFAGKPVCVLSRTEKVRILGERIMDCLTEAVYLGVPKETVRRRFEESLKEFNWPEDAHE